MNFKEMIERDNKCVFLNTSEFTEIHTVRYDGETYTDIPVLLTKTKERKRPVTISDHMEGIHKVAAVAHIALSDLNGVIPEQKQDIYIDDGMAIGAMFFQRYKIVTSDCEMGMLNLELEAFDE